MCTNVRIHLNEKNINEKEITELSSFFCMQINIIVKMSNH